MNLKQIQIWILDTLDEVKSFCKEKWEEQRLLCIAVFTLILLVILLLILIPALNNPKPNTIEKQDEQIQTVEIDPFLSIPPEPHIEDDYVYTRKDVKRWSEEEVSTWFSEPDDEMLHDLKQANDKLVDDMLEVVP